jgi:GGDEF domain-containing protein
VGPEWARDLSDSSVSDGGEAATALALAEGAARSIRSAVRESDAVGQMGPYEFVIVALGLDHPSATRLADRILENLEQGPSAPPALDIRLRAGVYVTPRDGAVDPEHLLSKATMALRRAQAGNDDLQIRSFDA